MFNDKWFTVLATVSGMIVTYITNYQNDFITLVIFMLLDIITGVCSAVYLGNVKSKTLIKGFIKKLMFVVLTYISHQLDLLHGTNIVEIGTIYFLIFNEICSILENLKKMDVPIPNIISSRLDQKRGIELKNNINVGDKINRLTVIGFDGKRAVCKCDCGNINKPLIHDLIRSDSRQVKSCGCLTKEKLSQSAKTHGLSKHNLYKKCKQYKNYGGRGITMCDEWKNDFQAFYDWSITNGYKSGLTIDRIDVNGNYEPYNCRWVDWNTQQNNRRNNKYISYNGKTMSLSDWCKYYNADYDLIESRMLNGWSFDRALNTPKQSKIFIWYKGKQYTMNALSKKLNIPYNTLSYNFKKKGYDYIKKLGVGD